jgi:site-specific recombinase XerD
MIQNYMEVADLDTDVDVTPHKFRHRFATDMLRATGGNLPVTQKTMGHAHPGTTAQYTHLVDADVDEAVQTLDAWREREEKAGP